LEMEIEKFSRKQGRQPTRKSVQRQQLKTQDEYADVRMSLP
jgi:hypothetical protein